MTDRYRVVEQNGWFYPQFRGWFGWCYFAALGSKHT